MNVLNKRINLGKFLYQLTQTKPVNIYPRKTQGIRKLKTKNVFFRGRKFLSVKYFNCVHWWKIFFYLHRHSESSPPIYLSSKHRAICQLSSFITRKPLINSE